MVYFKRHIFCAAPLAFVCLQPLNQAVASIVLDYSCYYVGGSAFNFGVPAETVIVEQHFAHHAVFLRIFHNKIFPLTVLADNFADSCPIFSGESFEHTVSHYIIEVVEYGYIVCEPVVALRTKCKKFAHKTQKGEESDSSGILAFFAYYYEMLRSRLV